MKRTLLLAAGVVLVLAAITTSSVGCVRRVPRPLGERVTETTQTVALAGAQNIDLRVEMGAGNLRIASTDSTENAVSGRFEFRPANLKPQMSGRIDGDTQQVRVDQPKAEFVDLSPGGIRNDWKLLLPQGVPTILSVTLGAGNGTIDARGIDLTALTVQQGAGNMTVDLSDQRGGLTVTATLGAGEATFRVPAGVPVIFDDHKSGLGDMKAEGFVKQTDGTWTNAAWDELSGASSESTGAIRLNVTRGVGDVRVVAVD